VENLVETGSVERHVTSFGEYVYETEMNFESTTASENPAAAIAHRKVDRADDLFLTPTLPASGHHDLIASMEPESCTHGTSEKISCLLFFLACSNPSSSVAD
jgi:hypothetical protein